MIVIYLADCVATALCVILSAALGMSREEIDARLKTRRKVQESWK